MAASASRISVFTLLRLPCRCFRHVCDREYSTYCTFFSFFKPYASAGCGWTSITQLLAERSSDNFFMYDNLGTDMRISALRVTR